MDERLKLTEEKKEQLLRRVKQCLDEDTLDMTDWMKIYDVLLEACEREQIDAYESYVAHRIVEGDIQ